MAVHVDAAEAHHRHADDRRHWIAIQPSVHRCQESRRIRVSARHAARGSLSVAHVAVAVDSLHPSGPGTPEAHLQRNGDQDDHHDAGDRRVKREEETHLDSEMVLLLDALELFLCEQSILALIVRG